MLLWDMGPVTWPLAALQVDSEAGKGTTIRLVFAASCSAPPAIAVRRSPR
jgi:hypothetical protein